MRLKGKTAIVTGGGRGIGYCVAERFVREGAAVALWDVNEADLGKARQQLTDAGGRVETYVVNVADAAAVARAFEKVEKDLGPVDVVVNNAGITRDAMVHKMTDEAWDQVIAVNLKGVFLVGREAARRMRERGTGCILNTSSIVGLTGNMGQTNYAASKAGVIAMTQTWARELGAKGVRVNAVAPGFTMTPMLESVPEKVLDLMKDKTCLKRLGKPEEIASVFAFLASDDAAYVTAQTVSVDGGMSL